MNGKLVPGTVLGRYELLLPIAQGGMATVWAARQRGTRGFSKTVAIKTMLPMLTEDPRFEQMFLDEAALAARIHHPNVAEILDLGEQDEVLYIVMEWVDGEALSVLHRTVRRNQAELPIRIALRVAMQACAGLHAAHELRDEDDVPLMLVHRDVSPQNILVTYDGIVKLVDFGIAKVVGRAGSDTSAGQLKGKVPYMSPEQARGDALDRRSDVFAMGIVLYKLTTGLHPYLGENDLVTMRNIISRPLMPPRAKDPSFPGEVQQILIKCLQKDPSRRYPSMAELGLALERALSGMGVTDDELGAYVRAVMGDRGAQRRASIRDAARTADERFATGAHQAFTPLPAFERSPDLAQGVGFDRLSTMPPSRSPLGLPIGSPPASSTWESGERAPIDPQATTDRPVFVPGATAIRDGGAEAAPESRPALRRARSVLAVGMAAALAVGILGFAVVRGGSPSPASPGETSRVTAAALPAPPPPPIEAPSAAPDVVPAPAVTASASPDHEEPAAKPTASPVVPSVVPSVVKAKAVRKVATDKVPIFTNPGF